MNTRFKTTSLQQWAAARALKGLARTRLRNGHDPRAVAFEVVRRANSLKLPDVVTAKVFRDLREEGVLPNIPEYED